MIGVVSVDLKRAFELVDRNILLEKMKYYGIKGSEKMVQGLSGK